ncbi:diacylglycerol/lipid kinase family protein [Fundicoccus sp. Sow4_D5]|uniref:diacylglycerol/lipid kinase family protein n=1 Tax=Fundicoccus sp. Sow4_D5 TaxID=3438782 RepID=UPI003F8F9C09
MLKNVLIIPNPGSGKGKAVGYGNKLGQVLEETYQATVEVRPTTDVGDAKQWSSTALEDGFDTVICLGGDGTVNETVDGLLQNDEVPYFGFVPLGTVNDLARVLGYDMNPDKAIEQYRDIKTVPLDIGQINGESHFINVIAIGAVPESVMHTDSDDKNKLGVLAYLRDGVKAYFNQDKYLLEIKNANGEIREIETNLAIVALTNSVAGIEVMIPHASYDDGLAHLIAPKGAIAKSTIQTLFEGGIHPEETDSMFVLSDSEITITCPSHDRVESNVDGDQGPNLPLNIKVLKHRLQAIVPA